MQILCMSCVFDTVSNENIQALKAIGRSDILLKLEIVKKPIYLFLLLLGLKISVMAMAETMVIYNVLAVLINMSPNRELLNYSFTEQIKDIIPALLSSIAMSFIVSFASRLDLAIGLVFFIKVILGVLSYVLIAILFKIRAFKEILTYRTK